MVSEILAAYHLPAVFAGAFFFGESVVITSIYLAVELQWSMIGVAIAIFAGTITSDTVWFFLGRILQYRLERIQWLKKQRTKASELLVAVTGERPFFILLFIKFLYGSRIAMIMYLAARNVPLSTFTLYNSLGAAIWLVIMLPLGYFAAQGVETTSTLTFVQGAITVLVISAIAFRLISVWLTRKLTKKRALPPS